MNETDYRLATWRELLRLPTAELRAYCAWNDRNGDFEDATDLELREIVAHWAAEHMSPEDLAGDLGCYRFCVRYAVESLRTIFRGAPRIDGDSWDRARFAVALSAVHGRAYALLESAPLSILITGFCDADSEAEIDIATWVLIAAIEAEIDCSGDIVDGFSVRWPPR